MSYRKYIYSVPGQEMAEHSANFGWLPLSDVAAVTKLKREPRWNLLGVPQTRQQISAINRPKLRILWRHWGHIEEILLFNKFFSDCQYVFHLQSCAMVRRWRCVNLWPPCVADADIIFLPGGFFYLLSCFPRLISAVADRMSAILAHMMWFAEIQDAKNRHLGDIVLSCRAISSQWTHVSKIGK